MRSTTRYLTGIIMMILIPNIIGFLFFKSIYYGPLMYRSVVVNTGILLIASELTDIYKIKFRDLRYNYSIAPCIKALLLHFIILFSLAMFNTKYYPVLTYMLFSVILFYAFETLFAVIRTYISKMHNSTVSNTYVDIEQADCSGVSSGNTASITIADLIKDLDFEEKEIITALFENSKADNIVNGELVRLPVPDSNYKPIEICPFLLNDLSEINEYLKNIYSGIIPTGFLTVRYEPIEEFYNAYWQERDGVIRKLHYPFHFVWRRMIPKIPIVNELQNLFTRGKKKIISKAEVWGRLHYCGFEVLNEIKKGNISYTLAQKKMKLSVQQNPSIHPLIRLERVGYQGEIFRLFKIRSMYPYSEFIQKKVYELSMLDTSGKLKNDFRITGLGGFLRKYWIDELPQILNWLKSDIKLVGIRAMSRHYFSLYPEYYQKKYILVKPGLIPPIFDDSVKDINKIANTELQYLESYLAAPISTDLKYFFSTLHDIVVKGVRSK